jgi:uncharacterized protein (TIGR00369 family)
LRLSPWNTGIANEVLHEHFAAWVLALGMTVEEVGKSSAVLRLPFHSSICRQGGIVSGQALATLADTAMVFAVSSAAGGYRPMATVDLHTTYMRAVSDADVIAEAVVERLGRTLAFVRVTMRAKPLDAASKVDPLVIVASAVGTFALP